MKQAASKTRTRTASDSSSHRPEAKPGSAGRGRPTLVQDNQWFESALKLMARGGVDAVRIDMVAEQAGVTKGAFYARFKSRDEFLDELLDYWRRESTTSVIDLLRRTGVTPEEQLLHVLKLPFRRPDAEERGRMEMAIRMWADRYERAAAYMREIDALRLQYFESVLLANSIPEHEVKGRAFLVYAYIIADGVLPGEREALVREQCRATLALGTDLAHAIDGA